jgi:hypothetical protein
MGTEIVASMASPLAATRTAVRGIERGVRGAGEAAKMLEDATVGNIQRARVARAGERAKGIPDTAYNPLRERLEAQGSLALAVRERGTPFVIADYLNPPVDQAQALVQGNLARTRDAALDKWFDDKVTTYLRRDYASPQDQFVKAAEEGKLLHFADKPTRDVPVSPFNEQVRDVIRSYRRTEGFSPQGETRTPYGQRVEEVVDNTAWMSEIEDVSRAQLPPFLRGQVETAPQTRITRLDDSYLLGDELIPRGESMDLKGLRDSMVKMRNNTPEFSAYNQSPISVPSEYRLTDEMLQGLTPAQASNRVALFNRWQDEARQKMASKAVNEDPNLSRIKIDDKHTMVEFPDIEGRPEMQQLVTDMGCDGGWCTQEQNFALRYGSGDNRLAVVFDQNSRPRAQMTFTERAPDPIDFVDTLPAQELDQFFRANPHIPPNRDGLIDIENTREFMEYARRQPIRREITELKGHGNTLDVTNKPFTPALQKLMRQLADQGIEIPRDVLQQVGLAP